jgi:phage-related protein
MKSPPLSPQARLEAGHLLRQLKPGVSLGLRHLRPMQSLGPRCHELRIVDERASWRILLRIDRDTVLVLEVFRKTTAQRPQHVLEACQSRSRRCDSAVRGDGE